MNTPTPGPWEQRTLMVVAPDGSQICHTGGTRYQGPTPQPHEAEANARLISAAPDMLKTLIQVRGGLDAMTEEGIVAEGSYEYVNEAIAKATDTRKTEPTAA